LGVGLGLGVGQGGERGGRERVSDMIHTIVWTKLTCRWPTTLIKGNPKP
jgi:hypothetical protein